MKTILRRHGAIFRRASAIHRRRRRTVNTRDVINDAHMERTIDAATAATAAAKRQRRLR